MNVLLNTHNTDRINSPVLSVETSELEVALQTVLYWLICLNITEVALQTVLYWLICQMLQENYM